MPYIGNTPALDYISYAVQNFTVTAGTTVYTLDYSVANENDIRLVINNVIQRPGVSFAYSATGTTLTLTSATLVTDTMYAVFIGRAVQTVTPPANSITNSMIINSTIDLTTKVTGVLPVANGGTNLSSGFFNGIKEADQWRITANYSYSASQAYATLTANWERVDTDGFGLLGTGMTESSGVFTFPSTGIYLVTFTAHAETATNNSRFVGGSIFTTTDGTNFGESMQINGNALASTMGSGTRTTVTGQFQFDVTNVTTHKVRFEVTSNVNTTTFLGSTDASYTCAGFIRLGDT